MNSRILPALSVIIAIAMFFGYVNPAWTGSIKETRAAIEEDNKALAAADRFIAQQGELAAARDAIDPVGMQKLAMMLPDSVDNVGLILDLNALAAKSGLALSNIDVAGDSSSPASDQQDASGMSVSLGTPANSATLSLSAVGTYTALKSFLVGVEKSVRLLDIQEVTVNGSDTGVYNYQLKFRMHWLR